MSNVDGFSHVLFCIAFWEWALSQSWGIFVCFLGSRASVYFTILQLFAGERVHFYVSLYFFSFSEKSLFSRKKTCLFCKSVEN